MSAPAIETRALRKTFGDLRVLDGIDLAVAPGESLVVIGGSGTGKSVLLKCILGLLQPDGGTVRIEGRSRAALAPRDFLDRVGMLFQGGALFDSLPVWQNVAFRHLRDGMARVEARERAIETLGRVGLPPRTADLYPAELSGGMQKRAALARAIAAEPAFLFCDEPTAGLDPILAGVINRLIRDSVDRLGATAITITHDLTTVRTVADRVALLDGGRIRWMGPAAAIDHSGDAHVEQFVAGSDRGPISTLR
ncbi:ABC transporter ATP-binding protein [Rubellimicrobium sp. CFH 75288]|uniref:ABC transporter ATP-binding protein n=1 Tax=Rubellimicrobium sp. CFH 75288 TaxID=2697034 RepID=UPI001412960F|nr:ATP-binding cassette domain-containing protein [Rubellimicrobium sp. CFH 75288]NAZ35979.1 ATP-binding cassette domain-containing protein [Rubellimicrobium sp. CFH 75288]